MRKTSFIIILLLLFTSSAWALKLNDQAPAFSLRDINGNNFFLSDYLGPKRKLPVKGIIISFFASYCKPCRHELPVLNDLVDEFEKNGIKIVIVGFKEDFDRFSGMLDEIQVNKPIMLSDTYGKVGQKYGVSHLPVTFFIGADGTVRDIIRGELPSMDKVFRAKAERLLK